MEYHFKNLVFEGGGVKGIAYVGALQELDRRGIMKDIARIGGTSAGAITAVLVGLNYSLSEIGAILRSLDFKKFMDDSWGVGGDTDRLLNDFGWYKGDCFRGWIGSVIEKKAGNSEATLMAWKDIILNELNLLEHLRYSRANSLSKSARSIWKESFPILAKASKKSVRSKPAIRAAISCDIFPCSYHVTAAAKRICLVNSSGGQRVAPKTLSGNSTVSVVISSVLNSVFPISNVYSRTQDNVISKGNKHNIQKLRRDVHKIKRTPLGSGLGI